MEEVKEGDIVLVTIDSETKEYIVLKTSGYSAYCKYEIELKTIER